MAVFQGLGGMWTLRTTEGGVAIGSLRKRFLDGCVASLRPEARLLSGGPGPRRMLNGGGAAS
jgi:hypothetical protein